MYRKYELWWWVPAGPTLCAVRIRNFIHQLFTPPKIGAAPRKKYSQSPKQSLFGGDETAHPLLNNIDCSTTENIILLQSFQRGGSPHRWDTRRSTPQRGAAPRPKISLMYLEHKKKIYTTHFSLSPRSLLRPSIVGDALSPLKNKPPHGRPRAWHHRSRRVFFS